MTTRTTRTTGGPRRRASGARAGGRGARAGRRRRARRSGGRRRQRTGGAHRRTTGVTGRRSRAHDAPRRVTGGRGRGGCWGRRGRLDLRSRLLRRRGLLDHLRSLDRRGGLHDDRWRLDARRLGLRLGLRSFGRLLRRSLLGRSLLRRLGLFGLLGPRQTVALGATTEPVGLCFDDRRRLALGLDAHRVAQGQQLRVGHPELFGELVHADLLGGQTHSAFRRRRRSGPMSGGSRLSHVFRGGDQCAHQRLEGCRVDRPTPRPGEPAPARGSRRARRSAHTRHPPRRGPTGARRAVGGHDASPQLALRARRTAPDAGALRFAGHGVRRRFRRHPPRPGTALPPSRLARAGRSIRRR